MASVKERGDKLVGPLGQGTRVVLDPQETAAIWAEVRDATVFAKGSGDLWRISVKPGDAPGVVTRLGDAKVMLDWGGGLIWAEVPAGTDLRAVIGEIKGHATIVRADADTRARLGSFHPEPTPLAKISAGLRTKFDPRGILNPGVMG